MRKGDLMKKIILAFCLLLATAQLTCAENPQSLSYFTRFTDYVTQFFSQPVFQTIRNFFAAQTTTIEIPKSEPPTTIPQPPSVLVPSVATPALIEQPTELIAPAPPAPPFPLSSSYAKATKSTQGFERHSEEANKQSAPIAPIAIAPTLAPIILSSPSTLNKLALMTEIPEIKSEKSATTIAPLIIKLHNDLNAMVPQDHDEIISPAIKKEMLQDLRKTSTQLDIALQTLSQQEQLLWNKKIKTMIDPAQQNIKTLMMDVMKDEWNHHGKELVQLAIGMTRAAMTSAGISFAMQAAQIGTGNVTALDTNALLIAGLNSAAAFALTQYQKYLAIAPEKASNIITQAIITPSVSTGNFTITMPSLKPSLNYWMISEGINIASRFMEENNNAVQLTLKNINVQEVLFGKQHTSTSSFVKTSDSAKATSNTSADTAITPNLSSFVHDVLSNENIRQALISVGGTVAQSALIGGLLYLAGFGYAESTMLESMGTAMLTAVAQGSVAQVANFRHSTNPGALINITSAPLGQQLFAIAGGTPQAATSAVIQAVATQVSNVMMEETKQEESGLKQIFIQASSGIKSGSASLWSSITSGWQGMKEIFTPLGTLRDNPRHMGDHENY